MDSNTGWSSQVLATLSTTDVSSNIHSFLAFALDAWTADSKASAPGSVWPYYIIEPNLNDLVGYDCLYVHDDQVPLCLT